jgi:hypothetical protein
MKTAFPEFYALDEDAIKSIWDNCIFVFDTNVLLNLYRFPEKSQADVLNILDKISSRAWLPHQVALEYQRNRPVVIAGQLNNFSKVKKAINDSINSLEGKFSEFEIKRNRNVIDTESFIEKLRACAREFEEELENLKQKRQDVNDYDPVREKLDSIFINNIGVSMSEDDLRAIQKEGEARFAALVPPGYADSDKKESYMYGKVKIEAKFGDLIIWKQIIKHAKENGIKDVIFITDDDKDDWWWIVNSSGSKTLGIRPELRQEILSEGGVNNFYMYNSARFVGRATDYLKISVAADSISQIEEVVNEQNEKKNLVYHFFTGRPIVTEEVFITNLKDATAWAKRNRNGYVGLGSFVKNVLGNLGYDYKHSYDLAEELEIKGVVKMSKVFDDDLQKEIIAITLVDDMSKEE